MQKKSKQNEILAELYRLNMISKPMLFQLSENIEQVANKQGEWKLSSYTEFIQKSPSQATVEVFSD